MADCPFPKEVTARYNIAPPGPAWSLRYHPHCGHQEWTPLIWGLVPSWHKAGREIRPAINARIESAADKPTFRGPMRHHRCLIPATGFYEWSGKQPYYFHDQENRILALAALYDCWLSPDGSEVETFCLLTTRANSVMRPIHHRMPVIIAPEDYEAWLDPSDQRASHLTKRLNPDPASRLIAHPVSPAVNTATQDDPCLIEPVKSTPRQATLFDER